MVKTLWSAINNSRLEPLPDWDYEDVGIFFLLLASLNPVLHLLARFHILSRLAITSTSLGLQVAVVMFLSAGLYSVLKLRHHCPVLKPLGWVVPHRTFLIVALFGGSLFAVAVALYLPLNRKGTLAPPHFEVLLLTVVLGPALEESLFRGCLLPTIAKALGILPAVVITAVVFALSHGPANLSHWLFFTTTGAAYGCLRVASRSTTAPALMHAAYNLALILLTAFPPLSVRELIGR